MKIEKQKKLAKMVAYFAAAVVLICTLLLVADYLKMRYRAPSDKALVESLEKAVQTDANVSVELTAERERQTDLSLKRDSRNLFYGYVLLVGAVLFLLSMNWHKSFEDAPALSLETIVGSRDQISFRFKTAVGPGENQEVIPEPEVDLTFVDEIISREGRGKDAAIPILRAVQTHYGYLPDEALRRVCDDTEITPAQIAGTSTFYAQFRLSPVGRHIVKLCHGTACHVSGIGQVTDELRRHLSIQPGEDTDPTRSFTLERVACLGCCSLAPVMMIDEETAGRLTPASACQALHSFDSKRSV
jgi:NADH:ubiquinone oxidoreductase subunit E